MNFYTVLNVDRKSSLQEIKQQYISLSHRYHPDKNTTNDSQIFLTIQQAWETLRDATLRKKYDKELERKDIDVQRRQGEVSEIIKLSEMNVDEEKEILVWPCRCGSNYEISLDGTYAQDGDMKFGEMIVICSGCSLKIKVENDL